MPSIIEPLYPEPDPDREARIVQDVLDLMKLRKDTEMEGRVKRWLALTLSKAKGLNRLPWWFTKRLFACKVYEGQDVFDLQGELDRIIGVFCPGKLQARGIDWIIQQRARADYYQSSNCGEPNSYGLCGGRLHLWPAPAKEVTFILHYSVPVTLDRVPAEWEAHLVDGVIGFYARHFDRSGLVEDAAGCTLRFIEGIKATRTGHFDSEPLIQGNVDNPNHMATTLFGAYTETSMTDYPNAVIRPAYQSSSGQVQILANKGDQSKNTRGTPMMQIGGNKQP